MLTTSVVYSSFKRFVSQCCVVYLSKFGTMESINLIRIGILILGSYSFSTAANVKLIDGRCPLPEFPSNGIYKVLNNSSNYNYTPGSYVNEYSALDIQCNPGFKRNNILKSVCIGSTWYPTFPRCFKTCPTLRTTLSTTFTCKLNGFTLDNCEYPIEGTTATVECAEFYEGSGPQISLPNECRNGKWNFDVFYCQPIRGIKHQEAPKDLIGAVDAKIGSYPWQVAVYMHEEQICGGAILSTHIVLSVAHCFSKLSNGDLQSIENYMLAGGKYYRAYMHPGDTLAQYSAIKDIKFPLRYKGSINRYEADIAIVFLATPFTLSVAVQPVCFDLTNSHEHEELIAFSKGVVSGWVQTVEGRNPSETLEELDIPFIDYDLCYNSVPNIFKTFITYDKICGGYLGKGKSVCRGNAGGALSFQYKKDSRYYVRGIISLSPVQNESQCDSNQYSVFTKVSKFRDIIVRSLRESQYLNLHCNSESFRCGSGECISKHSECDGIVDCQDKSDETENYKDKPCNDSYLLRCNYGAYINKNATYNGKQDCRDNSDEDNEKCSTTLSENQESNQCRLPKFPLNGRYIALRGITEYKSGTFVNQGAILALRCDKEYKQEDGTETFIICLNGVWDPKVPKCVRYCPSLNSTSTTTFSCKLDETQLDNCQFPANGTIAEVKCANFYEQPGLQFSTLPKCTDGSWNSYIPFCQPICGRKHIEISSVTNVTNVKVNSYPWQVTVFDRHEQHICSGAILSPHIVISAALCFTYPRDGSLRPTENYQLAAGKYYKTYNHSDDIFAQYSQIKEITLPERYKGSINYYEGNIAILTLVNPFELSVAVQPICFDATDFYEDEHLTSLNKGVLSVWRLPEESRNSSETLTELIIPLIDYASCFEAVPSNFRPFLTHDKICGGEGIRPGDSGGILSVVYVDGRYHIRGIASLAPQPEVSQNSNATNKYVLFTMISTYRELIAQKLRRSG